ncbi:MAG: hypothetical protein Q4G42_05880 [Neisseria sp.]|nr:hypothetical protein [Neisseria sp.]
MTNANQLAGKLLLAGSSVLGIMLGWAGLAYAQRAETTAQNTTQADEATLMAPADEPNLASLRYVAVKDTAPLRQVSRYSAPKRVYTRSSD